MNAANGGITGAIIAGIDDMDDTQRETQISIETSLKMQALTPKGRQSGILFRFAVWPRR